MKTLFLITARGGSKGIPDKNLREIGGIPLVGYKAISALRSKYCSRLIISTDSPEIQRVARIYGAEALFTRPDYLATDTATSADVVSHTIDFIEEETSDTYDAVMLLQPSSPFTRPFDYDGAVEMMIEREANLVAGVREVDVNSLLVGEIDGQGRIPQIVDQLQQRQQVRRQDIPRECAINGALYLLRWDHFKEHRSIYCDRTKSFGYLMDPYYSIDIDEMIDLHWAEFLVERGSVDLSYWR